MRRLLFLMISLCALLTLWPVMPLVAQTTVVSGGGTATSVSAAAFPLLAPNGTAAAPSYAFANDPNVGIYYFDTNPFGLLFSLQGTPKFRFQQNALVLASDIGLYWSSTTSATDAGDLSFFRDAANTLAQRNGTNPQTFNIYETFTDSSNYGRGELFHNGGGFFIGTRAAGTGTARSIQFFTGGGVKWIIENTTGGGGFMPAATDTYDLGTSALAVRNEYILRSIQGSKSKALVDATPTEFVRVAIPQTMGSNYAAGQVIYTVYARDATTGTQALHGIAEWSCINNAGTESCSTIIESQKTAAVVTSGTLTCALTHVTGLTDLIGIQANCDSSLTVTSMTIQYRLDMPQPNTVTPQ